MWKSIFTYCLLTFACFGFSTIPFTEVSAQETIAITSGNNQSTTRGQNFPNPVTFTVTNSGSPVNGKTVTLTIASKSHVKIGATENGNFSNFLGQNTNTNGEVTIYVKANEDALYDTSGVEAILNFPSGPKAKFTGTITDVLYFSEGTTTTRSVRKGTAADTNIGAPVSATHWANADSNTANDVTLTYSLEGTDAALFRIDSEGQLQNVNRLDDEATYSVTVKVEHKSGTTVRSSDTIEVTIKVTTAPPPPPPPVNPPPAEGTLPLVSSDPVETEGLTIKRIGNPTTLLSWNVPTNINAADIVEYQYSMDGGQTWTSTDSTDTSIKIKRDGAHTLPVNQFKVRAVSLNADGTARVVAAVISTPETPANRRIIQQCPVGWVRADRFGGRTPRALLYEVKLEVDMSNRFSIYKPVSVAIYVHPDEGLQTLDGWKLQVAFPNNHHSAYSLTAENSVVVDANIEGVAGGFAFIKNPEERPFPMVGMGFTGRLTPGFDYRLYDDQGRRVDFGISCYKRLDIFQVLKAMEEPSVLRKVDLETLDWDVPYLRSEWTVPVPVNVPGAPSLQGVNLVGKWADLKKQ